MREWSEIKKTMPSRNRLAGAGCKPPQAARVKSPGRERCGKGVLEASGGNRRRRTHVNCRSIVESAQMTSKPGVYVNPGSAWREPAYWPCDVRHRGSASSVRAPTLNCGNLRSRCEGKGTSAKREAESTDARSRGGATRSSDEVSVMGMERRGRVIRSGVQANCASRRSSSK
jgi:hypothetical protein